jgi:hypothetical protein
LLLPFVFFLFLYSSSRFFLPFFSLSLSSLSLFPYTTLSCLIFSLFFAFYRLSQFTPITAYIQSPPPLSIHSNAPHFSRSCGIKIRAGTQLLGAPSLQRPALLIASYWTPRTWEPEAMFSIIGIRWWLCKAAVLNLWCNYCTKSSRLFLPPSVFDLSQQDKRNFLQTLFITYPWKSTLTTYISLASELENSRRHRPNSVPHQPSQSLSLISGLILSSSFFKFSVYKKFPHQNSICIYVLSIQNIKWCYETPCLAPQLFAFKHFSMS